jgi:hypothetical protein
LNVKSEKMNAYGIVVGAPKVKRPLKRIGRRWRIILKRIFEKEDGVMWTRLV